MSEVKGGQEDNLQLYHVTVTKSQIVSMSVPTQKDAEGKPVFSPALQCQANLGFRDIKDPDQPRHSAVTWYLNREDMVGNPFAHELVAEKFINLKGNGEYLAVPPEIDDQDWKARGEEQKEAEKLLKYFLKKSEQPYVVIDDPKDQEVIVNAVLARQRKYAKEVANDPSLPQRLAA